MIGMGMILERAITSFKVSAADSTEADKRLLMIEADEIMHYIRTLEIMGTITSREANDLETYLDAVLHEYFS